MRQSGLWEQFFALIHLALSLNVSSTAFNNAERFYSPESLPTLIDYEELILKSGLPMNEIWLRIEKLRSAYNFLPCAAESSDPQRMVLNEDICHYIFPLINQNYNFDLFILILRLLKYPFESSLCQNSSFFAQEPHEFDQIEDILPALVSSHRNDVMDQILLSLVNEMIVPPSYVNSNLAHQEYTEVLLEILLSASKCFTTRQNLIVFRLYLRLERILVILEKTKLTKEFKKTVKGRIKRAIKKAGYEENLLVYNDFAWIEYEMEGFEAAEGIFLATMQQNFIDNLDFMSLTLSYVELLLKTHKTERAIDLLTESALGKVNFQESGGELLATKKLKALQKHSDLLKTLLEVEMKSDTFEIEDFFTPTRFLLVLKARTVLLSLAKSPEAALAELQTVIKKFPEKNQKHTFLREKFYELGAGLQNFDFIQAGAAEFPHNLSLLYQAALITGSPWYRIRSVLSKTLTTSSLVFLIAACKMRALLVPDVKEAYSNRILSILKQATAEKSAIRQNSLVWRFYLRALFDVHSNRTLLNCKNMLYEALDVCPWSKALYLDGAFFAPQELAALLDLVIEKQLRIHALPEELSILRTE